MRLFIDQMLRRALIHKSVGLQLEEEVEHVDQEKDYAGTARHLQDHVICGGGV
jgi:hypothetical protein